MTSRVDTYDGRCRVVYTVLYSTATCGTSDDPVRVSGSCTSLGVRYHHTLTLVCRTVVTHSGTTLPAIQAIACKLLRLKRSHARGSSSYLQLRSLEAVQPVKGGHRQSDCLSAVHKTHSFLAILSHVKVGYSIVLQSLRGMHDTYVTYGMSCCCADHHPSLLGPKGVAPAM